jgi:hypothetical protein
MDFMGNRHSAGAGDGFGVEALRHEAPPAMSGSSW